MGKHFFIDGNLVATTGDLYTRSISAGGTWHPEDAEVIVPPGGVMEITKDTGSIFDSYYVNGAVAAGGILGASKGAICAFADIYEFTIKDYKEGLRLIESMLDMIPSGTRGDLYLQQQYASVFSLMERFLSCTFVRQTCDREDSYYRVLESGELLKQSNKEINAVLKGPDGLTKQLAYIEAANRVIYHNAKRVQPLFKVAFDIDVNLSKLKGQLDIRNHIVHRFGYTKDGSAVRVSKSCVEDLIVSVDKIVEHVIVQVRSLPQSERMYP